MRERAQLRAGLAVKYPRRPAVHERNSNDFVEESSLLRCSRRGFLEGASVAGALVGLQDVARAADDVGTQAPVVNGATDGKSFSAAWSAVRLFCTRHLEFRTNFP